MPFLRPGFSLIPALLAGVAGAAWAADTVPAPSACEVQFKALQDNAAKPREAAKEEEAYRRHWFFSRARPAEYESLRSVKVGQIFTGPPVTEDGVEGVAVNTKTKSLFKDHFEYYLKSRYRSGQVENGRLPPYIAQQWKEWLVTQGFPDTWLKSKRAELLQAMRQGKTMEDFYNDQLIQWIKNGLHETFPDGTEAQKIDFLKRWLNSQDNSTTAWLLRFAEKRADGTNNSVKAYLTFTLKPDVLVPAVIGVMLVDPLKERLIFAPARAASAWTVEKYHRATELLEVTFSSKQKNKAMDTKQSLDEMKRIVAEWKSDSYVDNGRRKPLADIAEKGGAMDLYLPPLREVLVKGDPKFEEAWLAELDRNKATLDPKLSRRNALLKDGSEAARKDRQDVEGELATLLSSWLVYLHSRPPGEADKIPRDLSEPYNNAIKQYQERMGLDFIRLRTIERLEAYLEAVEKSPAFLTPLEVPKISLPGGAKPSHEPAPSPAPSPPAEAPALPPERPPVLKAPRSK